MTSIEQTGKSIEEATQLALDALGVIEDEVDVEILEEGSKGFLGLKQSPARVRVTLKNIAPAQKPASPEERPRPRQRPRPAPKPRSEAEPAQESKPPTTERAPARRRTAPAEQAKAPRAERPASAGKEPRQQPAAHPEEARVATEEEVRGSAGTACEVLQRVLDGIGVGGTASVRETVGNQVKLDVQSADAAVLIGRHGQTIDALQYLVSVITHKKTGTRTRISIDVEGYCSRREEMLRNHALSLAAQVRESGEEAVLEPLVASERRIIHAALVDNPDICTYSEGEEPNRRVVISPRK